MMMRRMRWCRTVRLEGVHLLAIGAFGLLAACAGAARADAAETGPTPAWIAPPPGATLPELPGSYAVGTTARELIDHDRSDSLAPGPQPRSVVAQLWYPAARARGLRRARYMSEAAGAVHDASLGLVPGTFASIQTRALADAPALPCRRGWPVLLFSPGRGASRSLYTVVVEGLASQGFVVVALDHPYDARVTQFPDGRALEGLPPPAPQDVQADATRMLALRVADILFVVDQLPALDAVLGGALDLDHVGVFGHSLGGAAAGLAMLADERIAAGANLDGTLVDTSVQGETSRPFLLITSAAHRGLDETAWQGFRSQLSGFYRELQLAGSTHATFTDLAPLTRILGVDAHVPADELAARVGSIDGIRATDIEISYLAAFFHETLRHWRSPLLHRPAMQYPEVNFLE